MIHASTTPNPSPAQEKNTPPASLPQQSDAEKKAEADKQAVNQNPKS